MAGKFRGWERMTISDDCGVSHEATAPVIISASRSTDIPAFFGEWFMNRLSRGYAAWINPWNGRRYYVSFARTRAFVFWSKNPRPFMKFLPGLEQKGVSYYFLYTLNDYEEEGLEPRLPSLKEREGTFHELSNHIGRGRVVWRFDPLLLSDTTGVDDLLSRVERIGSRLRNHTKKMVISFVDIAKYPRVRRSLDREGFCGVREFSKTEVGHFCSGLADINDDWGLHISACGEREDLSQYGIARGQCISGEILKEEFSEDRELMAFLGNSNTSRGTGRADIPFRHLKDPGQRGACGCIASKDIGQYSTCMHLCRYCYANASTRVVERNYLKHLARVKEGNYPESIAADREGI